jgi:hypothetical protein
MSFSESLTRRLLLKALGPAQGLPETRVGTFTQALYNEASKDGWFVISMKNDWRRIFSFD